MDVHTLCQRRVPSLKSEAPRHVLPGPSGRPQRWAWVARALCRQRWWWWGWWGWAPTSTFNHLGNLSPSVVSIAPLLPLAGSIGDAPCAICGGPSTSHPTTPTPPTLSMRRVGLTICVPVCTQSEMGEGWKERWDKEVWMGMTGRQCFVKWG